MACLLHNVGPSFNHWLMSVIATESGWIRMDFSVMSSGLFSFLWGQNVFFLWIDWYLIVGYGFCPSQKKTQNKETPSTFQTSFIFSSEVIYCTWQLFSQKEKWNGDILPGITPLCLELSKIRGNSSSREKNSKILIIFSSSRKPIIFYAWRGNDSIKDAKDEL